MFQVVALGIKNCVSKLYMYMYSRSQKNDDASVLFRPIQTPLHRSCQPFRMHACIISNWAWSFDMQKKEGQHIDSPNRIGSFILLWSS